MQFQYGALPDQMGELHLPATAGGDAGPFPVVILLHGGFWQEQYKRDLMTGIAADLRARLGVATVNLEYRRVGASGGGWPTTFEDVAAGVDFVARAPTSWKVDTSRIILLGHSAGGHLAVWAAGRRRRGGGGGAYAGGARVIAVVSQAGVLDLAEAQRRGVGGGAVASLLGCGPDSAPARYAAASPVELLPFARAEDGGTGLVDPASFAFVGLVHGAADRHVPIRQSERFRDAAAAAAAAGSAAAGAGGWVPRTEFRAVPGEAHFEHLDAGSGCWAAAVQLVEQALAGGGEAAEARGGHDGSGTNTGR